MVEIIANFEVGESGWERKRMYAEQIRVRGRGVSIKGCCRANIQICERRRKRG